MTTIGSASSLVPWGRAIASGLVVGSLVFSGMLFSMAHSPFAQAATSSGQTVTAKGYDLAFSSAPMPDLAVTVSQTKDLLSQGIVVSWTGGKKSVRPSGTIGGANFLQVAQCWREDPDHPGHPDRTSCQYGAFLTPGATRDSVDDNSANIAPEDAQYTVPRSGIFAPNYTSIPFVAADGEVVTSVKSNADHKLVQDTTVDVNTNQFFTKYTSNEISWAGSDETGAGSVKFEVQTVVQSTGLACGQPILTTTPITGQACWLVVIPRGESDSGAPYITKSGLLWDSWQHSVAIKLGFSPVGVNCAIGGVESQISGSELIAGAISSWQPNLCSGATGAAFVLSTGNESDPLTAASATVPSPLAFTSQALQTSDPDPLQYAPVGLSALAISFAIDRRVVSFGMVPAEYRARETQPFTALKLTPRLIAKLLTGSYQRALPPGATHSQIGYIDLAHPGNNARNLTQDKDFLAVNDPEWAYQELTNVSLSDLLMPAGRSDLAVQLWRYVMADKEAVAFLNGSPDPWGMIVNPYYSTNAAINPNHTALALPTDHFPKADPSEQPAIAGLHAPSAVNLVTWRPYTSDFEQGAYLALRGDGLALGAWDLSATPPKYAKTPRSLLGDQGVLALTTAAAAARFENITASLRNPAGVFVAPAPDGLLAAATAMTPTAAQSKVVEFNPTSSNAEAASAAYPLTMPIYAAINPLQTNVAQRAIYSRLIRYAVTDGQVPGPERGQLPAGYAPLPTSWVAQALAAATAIQDGISPLVPPTPAAAQTTTSPRIRPTQPSTVSAAAGAPVLVPTATPVASGTAAGPLLGTATAADPPLGPIGLAVPTGLLSGLAAVGAFPLYLRIRRKL